MIRSDYGKNRVVMSGDDYGHERGYCDNHNKSESKSRRKMSAKSRKINRSK
jgi:hypothetical protein